MPRKGPQLLPVTPKPKPKWSERKWLHGPCVHCKAAKCNRPRGLCWSCYYTPGLKEKYPSKSKYARRGVGDFSGAAAPCLPTAEVPGSLEKLFVLEKRAENKQELFHPLDTSFPISNRDRFRDYECDDDADDDDFRSLFGDPDIACGSSVDKTTRHYGVKRKYVPRIIPANLHKPRKPPKCPQWGGTGSKSPNREPPITRDEREPRGRVLMNRKQGARRGNKEE